MQVANYPFCEVKIKGQITERLILQEVMNRDGHFACPGKAVVWKAQR